MTLRRPIVIPRWALDMRTGFPGLSSVQKGVDGYECLFERTISRNSAMTDIRRISIRCPSIIRYSNQPLSNPTR
jgi:hypothetical protein